MNFEQFEALVQQGYNRIPLHRQVLVDDETPISSYVKLAGAPYSYLFESVQGGERWGRYSIIGLPCKTRIEIKDSEIKLIEGDQVIETQQRDDPLSYVAEFQQQFNVPEIEGLPSFVGGLVGYFGYDCVRYTESRLQKALNDPLNLHDVVLMLSEEVLVFDNLKGILNFVVLVDPQAPQAFAQGQQRLDELVAVLQQSTEKLDLIDLTHNDAAQKSDSEQVFRSSFGEQSFKDAVEKIREYILAGDCMQVVLSQRLSIEFNEDAFLLYRFLRHLNPSPYMFHVNLGDTQIVGASPEVLVRVDDKNRVTVRPLAGTRPRGKTVSEDLALEEELLNDAKELAEHLMLIDLGRNDVGRIAQTGSVELTDSYTVERYSNVMHISSNVEGRLKPEHSALDALRSILPAGTLSGAPKVRAMEIIDELEPVKRGIYGGAIGYLSWNGELDTAIAIRTAIIHGGELHVQAGAGVVADSNPEMEWKETMNKARAIFRAVDLLQEHSSPRDKE